MGRPFESELKQLPGTIEWASSLDVKNISGLISKYHDPVYIVGSGGSFSTCVYAADLLTSRGVFAKAVTPLELFYANATFRKSNLIFISASGNNTDILFAFKKAIESEPLSILSICMRKKSKLATLAAEYSGCNTFGFDPPAGKDGFLATNSLAAYFVILYRAIGDGGLSHKMPAPNNSTYQAVLEKVNKHTSFTILYGSYHHAVAVDLESKFSEAGLAPSLLCDYRHFAHGRHNWFDKQKNSIVIALSCPADEKLCNKTLGLLPASIPKIVVATPINSFEGTIHLLIQSMQLINQVGKKVKIDPGRPGVPPYGSKIYHLKYDRLVSGQPLKMDELAIARKAKVNRIADLEKKAFNKWLSDLASFKTKLKGVKFGCLIFDYDGTLCSPANRLNGPDTEIRQLLIDFVKKGFVIGIISGRGKSLRGDLEKIFKEYPQLMKNIVVGYYNGSDIAPLTDSTKPDKSQPMHPSLAIIQDHLAKIDIIADPSPNQLTFKADTSLEWTRTRDILINEIMLLDKDNITIVESSHSLDVIPKKLASKNHVLEHCRKLCRELGVSEEGLCIGDKGQWPGNDYALLANEFSLSVGEVSSIPDRGWNLCPPGLRDEKAVKYLFGKIKFNKGYFKVSGV
jgi:hydroxymethylpyrimidine pyrophosphatase-like HAD family hydrolase